MQYIECVLSFFTSAELSRRMPQPPSLLAPSGACMGPHPDAS